MPMVRYMVTVRVESEHANIMEFGDALRKGIENMGSVDVEASNIVHMPTGEIVFFADAAEPPRRGAVSES